MKSQPPFVRQDKLGILQLLQILQQALRVLHIAFALGWLRGKTILREKHVIRGAAMNSLLQCVQTAASSSRPPSACATSLRICRSVAVRHIDPEIACKPELIRQVAGRSQHELRIRSAVLLTQRVPPIVLANHFGDVVHCLTFLAGQPAEISSRQRALNQSNCIGKLTIVVEQYPSVLRKKYIHQVS